MIMRDGSFCVRNEATLMCKVIRCKLDDFNWKYQMFQNLGLKVVTKREDFKKNTILVLNDKKTCGKFYMYDGFNCYRFQVDFTDIDNEDGEDEHDKGMKAFKILVGELKKDGINIKKFALSPEQGKIEKMLIEKPMIEVYVKKYGEDVTFEHVNHCDIHSSYPSGLVELPQYAADFGKTIRRLYEGRHFNKNYKLVLNAAIGYFQSKYKGSHYAYAKISQDCITHNNAKIRQMMSDLKKAGRKILLTNTDGIWYQGKPFMNKNFFNDIGGFSNDYINCKMRIKSKGVYEFVDATGTYYPKLRGKTDLDRVKDRKKGKWEWGDIFKTQTPLQLVWDIKKGIVGVDEQGETK